MQIITNISTSVGTNIEFAVYFDPTNATNKKVNITSSDESVFTVKDNTIIPVNKGTAKLIIDHPDYHREIEITVSNQLSSDIYEVDHVNKTIFVNTLNVKEFTKELLVSNLKYLSSDYTIDNQLVNNKLHIHIEFIENLLLLINIKKKLLILIIILILV